MTQNINKLFIYLSTLVLLVWAIAMPSSQVYGAEISSNSPDSSAIIWGDHKSIGTGQVTGWIKVDAAQAPVSIGITLTEDAVATAPANDQAPAGSDGR